MSFLGLVALVVAIPGEARFDASNPQVRVSPPVPKRSTTYFRIYCTVYLDEKGLPKSVKALRTEPKMQMTQKEMQSMVDTVLTWTFKPIEDKGKPVAGSITTYVGVHLADPMPLDDT